MTEGLQAGLLSLVGVIVGVLITQFFEWRRRVWEQRRWYADHFLARKIDALSDLYAQLVECHDTISTHKHFPPKTLEQFLEQVHASQASLGRTHAVAWVYLDDEANGVIATAIEELGRAYADIVFRVPEAPGTIIAKIEDVLTEEQRAVDWENVTRAYEQAQQVLRRVLNPRALAVLDSSSVSRCAQSCWDCCRI